jgi:hypothetical protein
MKSAVSVAIVVAAISFPCIDARSDDLVRDGRPIESVRAVTRVPLTTLKEAFAGTVVAVQSDGIIQIKAKQLLTVEEFRAWYGTDRPYGWPRVALPPSEGYYAGLVCEGKSDNPIGGRLFRVQLLEIGQQFAIRAKLDARAAKSLAIGETMRLFRPLQLTTKEMMHLPDVAVIFNTKQADHEKQLAINRNRVKDIVLAMHNYLGANGSFPPAFVAGPDGKPWHSWRVLLLPFLNQQELYDKYSFDEPWNGPHNIKLLARMPEVYSDPIYGENKQHYAHVVAIVGVGMAFSVYGGQLDDQIAHRATVLGLKAVKGGRKISEFKDGTSNTILVATVGPSRRIPWLKPEDLAITGKIPPLGTPDGFATPYEIEANDHVGVFGMADGSAQAIRQSTNATVFAAFLTLDGPIRPSRQTLFPRGGLEKTGAPPLARVPVIRIERTKEGFRGNYAIENIEERMLIP